MAPIQLRERVGVVPGREQQLAVGPLSSSGTGPPCSAVLATIGPCRRTMPRSGGGVTALGRTVASTRFPDPSGRGRSCRAGRRRRSRSSAWGNASNANAPVHRDVRHAARRRTPSHRRTRGGRSCWSRSPRAGARTGSAGGISTVRPLVDPFVTYRPPRESARRARSNTAVPMLSSTTSTPAPSVAARTSSSNARSESNTASAPCARPTPVSPRLARWRHRGAHGAGEEECRRRVPPPMPVTSTGTRLDPSASKHADRGGRHQAERRQPRSTRARWLPGDVDRGDHDRLGVGSPSMFADDRERPRRTGRPRGARRATPA